MRNNITPTVEGGLLVAISVILGLCANYLPVFGAIVEFFCAVPFVILTVRHGIGKSLLALTVSFFLLSMFMGPILAARIAITLNICGVILGFCIEKNFSTVKSFLATFVTAIFAQSFAIYILMAAMGINFTETELTMLKESFEESFAVYEKMGVDAAQLAEMRSQVEPIITMVSYLMPTVVILMALLNSIACYLTSKWIFAKLRFKFIEPLPKFSAWKFPIFFLYVAAFAALGLYWSTTREINLLYIISINSLIFALAVGFLQGLAVLTCAADKYNLSKFWRRIIFVVIILNGLFLQIVSFIGLLDMIFDYRKKLLS